MAEVTISGGEKLERRLREISETVASGAELRVGFLSTATYPDGKYVASVAAWQEFGTGRGIPPRPFFRGMIKRNSALWPSEVGSLLTSHNYDATVTLSLMGERIAGQLRQSITELVSPPLAAATARRKGFSKPLVDTGHMLNSVDYEVTTP